MRSQLGLPADATDGMVPDLPEPDARLFDVDEPAGAAPGRVRMLVFQRSERALAVKTWPEIYDAPDEEHYPAAERGWRELADSGVPSISAVPATVAGLLEYAEETGEDPTDPQVKTAYLDTLPRQLDIAWPPAATPLLVRVRRQYKKCCGRAT
ncbi:hypothetical protein ACFQX7_39125 [Luedemannella flava]